MKRIGCIFDWDGTVVDSGRTHEYTWIELAKSRKLSLKDDFFNETFGKRNVEIITSILRWTDDLNLVQEMSDQKEILYRKIVAERGLPLIDGVEAFLQSLLDAKIDCAIGSSTPRENLDVSVAKLGFGKYFKAIVASEDVSRGKPAPDVFLTAAERLGLRPDECVVFEDSLAGIQAGVAAGMKTVAIATTNSVDFWKDAQSIPTDRADLIIENFSEISVVDIANLLA